MSIIIPIEYILCAGWYLAVGLFIVAVYQTVCSLEGVDDRLGAVGFLFWTFCWPLAPIAFIVFLFDGS